ncbi:hypothetical protein RhiirA1_478715 [Rhizophagus irregularis]|nr:hypothetical protein RhiirA1_478715 [Rhizophagus irregularis]
MFDSVDEDTMNGNHSVQNIVTYKFKDFDEVIPVAKRLVSFDIPSSLYKYDNIYYVAVDFTDVEEKSKRQNIKAILNEFLTSSKMTIYRLQEYGEEIMQDRCFETVIQYFD